MGRGACVIANDVPEHREVLGAAGLYYRRGDPAALAARLRQVRDDAGLRERLGSAAAARAATTFSWEAVTTRYERLFQRLVGQPVAD
jgi:phosphatidylinositol alpha-mannosyltransferase